MSGKKVAMLPRPATTFQKTQVLNIDHIKKKKSDNAKVLDVWQHTLKMFSS